MGALNRLLVATMAISTLAAGSARAGSLTAAPLALNFPNTGTGSCSSPIRMTFTNTSNADLTVDTVLPTGANAAEFTIAIPNGVALPTKLIVGVGLDIDVTFCPVSPGARTAKASAQVRGEVGTNDAPLAGTGIGPKIGVIPNPIVIGGLTFGQPVQPLPVNLTNAGGAQLHITGVSLSGGDAARFMLSNVPAFPLTLGPGVKSQMMLAFTPLMPAQANAIMTVTSDDPMNPVFSVPIIGLAGDPKVTLDIGTIFFGNTRVGQPAIPQDVNISNTGLSDLHISSVSVSGANVGDFTLAQAKQAPYTLTVGATAKLTANCLPTVAGARSASVQIVSDDPSKPIKNLTMTCTGTTPMASVTPNMVNFGSILVGQTGNQQVLITNLGTGPVVITDLILGGNSKALFTLDKIPGFQVAAGASVPVQITYKPVGIGDAGGTTLTIKTDDPNLPTFQVVFSATGISPVFSLMPGMLQFGGIPVGMAPSPTKTFTITNTGNANLIVKSFQIGGSPANYVIAPDWSKGIPGPLAPKASQDFTVTYTPTASGDDAAQVTISVNDPNNMSGTVQIDGNGLQAEMSTTPMDMMSLDFGPSPIGVPKSLPIKINNTGGAALVIDSLKLSGMMNFTFDQMTPFSVPSTKSQTVNVTCTPKVAGDVVASVTIVPHDPGIMPVLINLTCTGTSTMISTTPTKLDFGSVTACAPGMQDIRIRNGAISSQTIEVSVDNMTDYSLDLSNLPSGNKFAPGSTGAVTVTCTPSQQNIRPGNLIIKVGTTVAAMVPLTCLGVPCLPDMEMGPGAIMRGGGCSVAGRDSSSGFALFLGLAGLALVIRRRRRA